MPSIINSGSTSNNKLLIFLNNKGLKGVLRHQKWKSLYALRHKKWLYRRFTANLKWQIKNRQKPWWIKKKRKWLWNKLKWIRMKRARRKWRKKRFFKKLPALFRQLGFKVKSSHIKKIHATKAYRKAKLYEKALNISRNKLKLKEIRPTQPRRSVQRFSFFKVKYLLRKFVWKRYFGNIKWAKFYKNTVSQNKHKLLNFICNNEMRLLPLLLRTNLIKTAETAKQLIKHGFVFINYRSALKPYLKVAEGDTLTLQINTIKHRFFDGFHEFKEKPWLRKAHQNIVFGENLSHAKKQYRLPSTRRRKNKYKIANIIQRNLSFSIKKTQKIKRKLAKAQRKLHKILLNAKRSNKKHKTLKKE